MRGAANRMVKRLSVSRNFRFKIKNENRKNEIKKRRFRKSSKFELILTQIAGILGVGTIVVDEVLEGAL